MCAVRLDDKRLRKQCVESYQIIDTLHNRKKAWGSHPAVKMWEGSVRGLCIYTLHMCNEYEKRFGKAMLSHKFADSPVDMREALSYFMDKSETLNRPVWWSDRTIREKVNSSHRSNLLRKDPDFYGVYGWKESPNIPYYWPV